MNRLDAEWTPAPLPPLDRELHKGRAGRLLCFAGSRWMPGAAILVARSAQRAGAGLVTLAAFEFDVTSIVATASPETVYLDLSEQRDLLAGRLPALVSGHVHDARLAGPGMGVSGRAGQLVQRLLDAPFEGPLVLDADALNLIGPRLEWIAACPAPVVLTPHPGEAARLLDRKLGSDPEARLEAAAEIARGAGAVCVLKGAGTVVSDGERGWVCPLGNPGMATAGSGDVLCGVLGAYLAAWARERQGSGDGDRGDGRDLFDVVARGVLDHAAAGDRAAAMRGPRAVTASDLIGHLGEPGG